MTRECFYLGLEGSDTQIFHKGLHWLFENSKLTGGWVAVNNIRNLENISGFPGLDRLSILAKDKYRNNATIDGVTIYVITKYSVPHNGINRALLAIHPTKDYLDKLDAIPNISKMMVIPFIAKEVDEWSKCNDAVDYDSMMALDNEIIVDEVVAVALKHLTNSINLTKNISIGQERYAIIDTFSILILNGYDLSPDAVKKWLQLKCGWGPISAKQAAEIVEDLRSGKEKLRKGFWDGDTINQWREEARKDV
jgi:hypothetical protein